MKTLFLLRHAKSSWKDDSLADHERPLNKRGKRDALRMGRLLREEDLFPDIILCSTAERARRTIEAVIGESGFDGSVRYLEDLYAAPAEVCLEMLSGLEETFDSAMLVAHNPGLEELLEMLTGESESLPTAALAQIELPLSSWQELVGETSGELVHLWRPRDLN